MDSLEKKKTKRQQNVPIPPLESLGKAAKKYRGGWFLGLDFGETYLTGSTALVPGGSLVRTLTVKTAALREPETQYRSRLESRKRKTEGVLVNYFSKQ